MSYTCRDHGEGNPCNGCQHNPFGFEYAKTPPEYTHVHPFGCNRAERRAAMKSRKPGFSKREQQQARFASPAVPKEADTKESQ